MDPAVFDMRLTTGHLLCTWLGPRSSYRKGDLPRSRLEKNFGWQLLTYSFEFVSTFWPRSSIPAAAELRRLCLLCIQVSDGRSFDVTVRFDTDVELVYFRHGGILNYMIRQMLWGGACCQVDVFLRLLFHIVAITDVLGRIAALTKCALL